MVRRPLPALLAVAACAAGAAAVWLLAVRTATGAELDARTLSGFMGLDRPGTNAIADSLAHLMDTGPFSLFAAALVATALARGRPRLAIAVTIVLLGANLTTQLLKPLLAAPRSPADAPWASIGSAAWPSGHTTAGMTVALCAVLVATPRLRPLVAAVGGMLVTGVVLGLLVLGWHYPSDVLGGFLVAAAWTALAIAALELADRRWPARRGRPAPARGRVAMGPLVITVAGAALALAAVVASRPGEALAYAEAHTTFVAVALTIPVCAFALTTAAAAAAPHHR